MRYINVLLTYLLTYLHWWIGEVCDCDWWTGVAPAQWLLPVEACGRRSPQQRRREPAGKDGPQQHVLRQFARWRQDVPPQLRREPVQTGGDQHHNARSTSYCSRQARRQKYATPNLMFFFMPPPTTVGGARGILFYGRPSVHLWLRNRGGMVFSFPSPPCLLSLPLPPLSSLSLPSFPPFSPLPFLPFSTPSHSHPSSFPSSFPSPFSHFPPFSSPPLEVGPLNTARGFEGAL